MKKDAKKQFIPAAPPIKNIWEQRVAQKSAEQEKDESKTTDVRETPQNFNPPTQAKADANTRTMSTGDRILETKQRHGCQPKKTLIRGQGQQMTSITLIH